MNNGSIGILLHNTYYNFLVIEEELNPYVYPYPINISDIKSLYNIEELDIKLQFNHLNLGLKTFDLILNSSLELMPSYAEFSPKVKELKKSYSKNLIEFKEENPEYAI